MGIFAPALTQASEFDVDKYTPGCSNGAFLFQDEFQMLMSGRLERHFVQVYLLEAKAELLGMCHPEINRKTLSCVQNNLHTL